MDVLKEGEHKEPRGRKRRNNLAKTGDETLRWKSLTQGTWLNCHQRSLLVQCPAIAAAPEATSRGSCGEKTRPSRSLLGIEDNSWYLLKDSNLRGTQAVNLETSLLDESQRASQLTLCEVPVHLMRVSALPMKGTPAGSCFSHFSTGLLGSFVISP